MQFNRKIEKENVMSKLCSVAIDGPSGAGKSTLARAAAKRFGYIYVDTGAIYRTVGLACRRSGADIGEKEQVLALLPGLQINLGYDDAGLQRMYLNGEDVSGEIRENEISHYASAVSAHPAVRAHLSELQKKLAREQNVIMDGRDIGTVILPDAQLKIFLSASPEARAARRAAELRAKGQDVTDEQILLEMRQRDEADRTRAVAPAIPAKDAVMMDNSNMTIAENVAVILALLRERHLIDG